MPEPEALARIAIDQQLEAAGWAVQDRAELNLFARPGVAIREVSIPGVGEAAYLLVAGRKAVGNVEAKPAGTTLTGVEPQTRAYAKGMCPNFPHWTAELSKIWQCIRTALFGARECPLTSRTARPSFRSLARSCSPTPVLEQYPHRCPSHPLEQVDILPRL